MTGRTTMWIRKGLVSFALLAFGGLAVAVSGCGGSADAGGSTTASGADMTVSVEHVDGVGNVLVDSKGDALYSPDQEANGMILCKGSCISIWVPLTLSANANPSGPGDVNTMLGTIHRPDGSVQVTFHTKPLYTFAEDTSPGMVTGNGAQDQFGGHQFTWHVASVGAVTSTGTSTARSSY
jgi:predicted lipoprotein with Yx(FWY)xxD motif